MGEGHPNKAIRNRSNTRSESIMDPDIKKEWLDRLRSGDYTQITGQLRDEDNGRCCLGVLCDVYAEQNDGGEWDDTRFVATSDADNKVLPSSVVEWAKLQNYQGADLSVDDTHVEEGGGGEFSLSMLNDGLQGARRHTFDEIADLIEQNL